jgi:hypothetical protein
MANEQNLQKYSEMTPEQQREFHSKGGIASQKIKAEQKTLREIAKSLGDMEVNEKVIEQYQKLFPNLKKNTVAKTLIMAGAYQKAIMERDVSAMKFIAEVQGEVKQEQTIVPIQININGEDSNC